MISVKNLHKSFGSHEVLKGIDFELKKGERVVVLGPSGSGKSTFLRCINRLEVPTNGEIFYKNIKMTEKNISRIRESVGMVFQHFNLIENFTVMENLTLAPVTLEKLSRKSAEKKARDLLKFIDLEGKADSYPSSLSGGQKQRIAIVRSLMMDPDVILFDEPTSALDPESIGDVLSLIKKLAKSNITLVIVTHEINFAREIATRIVFIDDGKIIEDSDPKSFFSRPSTPRARTFLKKVL